MLSTPKKNRRVPLLAVIVGFFVSYTLSFSVYSQVEEEGSEQAQIADSSVGSDATQSSTAAAQTSQSSPTQANPNELESNFNPLSADSWMQRLIEQVKSSSFEIVYVVSSNKRETLPYMWRKGTLPDGSAIEQLSLLNGPGFEQVAHRGKVSIFEPGYPPYSVQGMSVQGPIPQAFVYEGVDFKQAYDALLMGRNRVAGRMAQQIRVISKDKTRFGYHLWLDEQTGFLLKLDMYDLDNTLLEQIQVTQLSLSDNVNQLFSHVSVDQLPQVSAGITNNERKLQWRASYLPRGMRVVKQDIHRIERTGQITEYILLSDGLVDVSVYVMQANEAFTEDMSIASNSHAIVSKTDGRVQVTVVGEIPVPTADKIANSIVIVENSDD